MSSKRGQSRRAEPFFSRAADLFLNFLLALSVVFTFSLSHRQLITGRSSYSPSRKTLRLNPRSWGASTSKQMCIQAVLDGTGALRHMNKNNSERPVCTTHPLTPVSTFFLFVFDAEWVMSTCEHQGRDTVLQTGLKIHWSRRSASCCFNRVWRVTKSSAKHQSMLSPWVMQH